MSVTQIRLPSGRGVRYRLLSVSQHDKVVQAAAVELGKGATNLSLSMLITRYAIESMLVEVTKDKLAPSGPKGLAAIAGADELAALPASAWKKVGDDVREQYDALFTTKDHATLVRLYEQEHALSGAEVDAILGEARPVSAA